MSTKLNVLLGKTDALGASFKAMITDMGRFFSQKQGAFLGERKTYTANEGTVDEPNRRGNVLVQTTVSEKITWLKDQSREYLSALFAQEKTNASGLAKAELIVNGENWGEFTSLELLRLKNIVENTALYQMMANIPVRSDAEEWNETRADMYSGRAIFEQPELSGISKTTEKENYILKDPNVDSSSPNYTPSIGVKTTTVELGNFTHQKFSGEWSQRQKAEALSRRTVLLTSIIEALKTCNEAEAIQSDLDPDKILSYLFG